MEYIQYRYPILQVLDDTMMVRGILRSGLTVRELSEQLVVDETVVVTCLRYLETREYVTCVRDILGHIVKANITLDGASAVMEQKSSVQ